MNIVIAAGGTGGHIFPALSVALRFKDQFPEVTLIWIGTKRSREAELAAQLRIPLRTLEVSGFNRTISVHMAVSFFQFLWATLRMYNFFKKYTVHGVIAFGGYVCAPILTAARIAGVPFYLQEQNSVPGMVNRFFSRWAKLSFLGFPVEGPLKMQGKTILCGNPVRPVPDSIKHRYPPDFSPDGRTILISGGSQGAASMNECLLQPMKRIAQKGVQIVWQTGTASFERVREEMKPFNKVFIFDSIKNLYPYYAVATVIVCRAGASTLAEAACFGLPAIMVPLPWSTENHQWINAGFVESKGWGIRVAQNESCGDTVLHAVEALFTDQERYERMRRTALEQSPSGAAAIITQTIVEQLRK